MFKNIINGLLLLAALMLTACEDKEPVMMTPQEDVLSRFNNEGRAWMTVDVIQPEQSDALTRAVGFDDDLGSTYQRLQYQPVNDMRHDNTVNDQGNVIAHQHR